KPFAARRARLEVLLRRLAEPRLDISPLVPFATWDDLKQARADPAAAGAGPGTDAGEGAVLKRRDSTYVPRRPRGLGWKWKRHPCVVDAVLVGAQRGGGKRASFYSDCTLGVWGGGGGDELVRVGKAYFRFTEPDLAEIDRFIRRNTINRFGPV